jgi:hypothetical protein
VEWQILLKCQKFLIKPMDNLAIRCVFEYQRLFRTNKQHQLKRFMTQTTLHQHQQQNQPHTPVNKPTAIARCDPVSQLTKAVSVKKNIKNIIKERASKLTYPQFFKDRVSRKGYRRGSFRLSFTSSTV